MAQKGDKPMKGKTASAVAAGAVIAGTAGSCLDAADVADHTSERPAHADDQDLSALEAPGDSSASDADDTDGLDASVTDESAGVTTEADDLDAGANESAGVDEPSEAALQGVVHLILKQCHADGELLINESEADPSGRDEITCHLSEDGFEAVISRELGPTARFAVRSTRMTPERTLQCEVPVEHEHTYVHLDFELGNVLVEPLTEEP